VVGRETRSPVERLFGAGTTSGVAGHAAVPVLVVPQDWQDAADHAPVVVGLKSLEHCDDAFGAGFRAAQEAGVPMVVVHAWKLPSEYDDRLESRTHSEAWFERGRRLADEALTTWRRDFPDVPVTVEIVHAEPARALVAASEDARLVVLARRQPHLLGRHLGGTAAAVVRAAHSPVLVVPASRLVIDEPGLEIEQSGAMLR
jgi:nucleotide-binding universal stress UspA family protein